MKKISINKNTIKKYLPCCLLGVLSITTCATYLGLHIAHNNEVDAHLIEPSNKGVFGQKEESYFVLEYVGTPTSNSMIRSLKEVAEKTNIGWYMIDYSKFNAEELGKLGIEYDPQYRVINTKTDTTGKKEKQLLYTSYGLKTSNNLIKEVNFVENYGKPDAEGKNGTKIADNVNLYFENLEYEEKDTRITLDLRFKTNDNKPMSIDIKDLYVEDIDNKELSDKYKISTSATGQRASYDPINEDGEENTEFAKMPITITIPSEKKDTIKGIKLGFRYKDKQVDERTENPLDYRDYDADNNRIVIDMDTIDKISNPIVKMDNKENTLILGTSVTEDNETAYMIGTNYFKNKYSFTYKENDIDVYKTFKVKDDKNVELDGSTYEYKLSENGLLTFETASNKYEFTFNNKTNLFEGKVIKENEEYPVKFTLDKYEKSIFNEINKDRVEYKLDLTSENLKYYYRFSEEEKWTLYDNNVGIKEKDIKNNRIYVRSEYEYKDNAIERKFYSMVTTYIKAHNEPVETKHLIRLN